MSGYDEARRRFDRAVAARDRLEADLALSDMKQIVADADIAEAVRDVELFAMSQACHWWWV